MTFRRRSIAVCAALVLDRIIPEPSNTWHPVAWFGTAMTELEHRLWADSRQRGMTYTAAGFAVGAASGVLLRSSTIALTIALGGAQLRSIARGIGGQIERGDVLAARKDLRALVGRDTRELDESGIAAAVVESVGENAVDAVVAPLFWTLVAGPAGALGYRAINTMDAMVGHRSQRFENFGFASARLDDVANWLPARLFAASVWLTNPARRPAVARAVRDDAPAHPSPNAGVAEASLAAALQVEVGGTLNYGDRVEHRPTLGQGPRPSAQSIALGTDAVDRATASIAIAALAIGLAGNLRSGLRP